MNGPHPPKTGPWRLARDIGLIAGALLLLALGLHETPEPFSTFRDIDSYRAAGEAMRQGAPLYDAAPGLDPLPLPPGFAAAWASIVLLPEAIGFRVWAVLVWLSIVVATGLVWRWAGRGAWLLGLFPYAYLLMHGWHVDALAIAMVVAAVLSLRARRDALAGSLLAGAAHLAFYPAFLLPVLWLLGRRKAFRAGTMWLGGLALVPLIWLLPARGWDAFIRLPQLYAEFLTFLWNSPPAVHSVAGMFGAGAALVATGLVVVGSLRRARDGRLDSLALLYAGLVLTGPGLRVHQGVLAVLPLAIVSRRDPKLAGGLAVALGAMELAGPPLDGWQMASTLVLLFVWLVAYRGRVRKESDGEALPAVERAGDFLRALTPLKAPSAYLLVLAFAVTAASKLAVFFDLEASASQPVAFVGLFATDALVFFGLASVLGVLEWRARRAAYATVPVALLVTTFATVNALCLGITGEQLTAEAVTLGLRRFADLSPVFGDAVSELPMLGMATIFLVVWGIPGGALYLLWRRLKGASDQAHDLQRARWTGGIAGVAGLLWLIVPHPDTPTIRHLGSNAIVRTAGGWVAGGATTSTLPSGTGTFSGYEPRELVDDAAIKTLKEGRRPNVLVFVQESLRWDHTSLAGDGARASTPNLARLAARGAEVRTTRAVVPHTTKSLFSILCGRYPIFQQEILEVSTAVDVQCLTEILREAGYRTAFFQSAPGTFEDRPRLVATMGFEEFTSWERLGGERLSYLSSDDESLTEPVLRWLDADDGTRPFFLVVLTSATHFPYSLSSKVAERVARSGAPARTPAERYARLTEAADGVLGSLLEGLNARGLEDETLVVAMGDHGEGFGDKGIRQHDNNYYEEGLRVPLVFAGPGVPEGVTIPGNASLVDVTPSLLALLSVPLTPTAVSATPGVSVWDGLPDQPRYFSCWYDGRCHGFVEGSTKVVFLPERRIPLWFDLAPTAVWFDLKEDPEERAPRPLGDVLAARLPELRRVIDGYRNPGLQMELDEGGRYLGWGCAAARACQYGGIRR